MREAVHERELELADAEGVRYDRCLVYAEADGRGTWAGWIEFRAADGVHTLRTGRETTQSTAAAVAYWATGLQPTYLEGALARARRRVPAPGDADGAPAPSEAVVTPPVGVRLRIHTADPEVPFRFLKTRTLAPGFRRYVHNGGVIIYVGPAAAGRQRAPVAYDFLADFGSENAAAVLANRLWSDLHGEGVTLEVDGRETPIENGAIKDALLGVLTR
jgi:hypothetical protein